MNKRREELNYFLNILENLKDFNNDLSEKKSHKKYFINKRFTFE